MDAQVSEDTDFIARIRALAPEIAAASDEIEERRELPPWLLDKLTRRAASSACCSRARSAARNCGRCRSHR